MLTSSRPSSARSSRAETSPPSDIVAKTAYDNTGTTYDCYKNLFGDGRDGAVLGTDEDGHQHGMGRRRRWLERLGHGDDHRSDVWQHVHWRSDVRHDAGMCVDDGGCCSTSGNNAASSLVLFAGVRLVLRRPRRR
jgi:hypothetical protein